MDWGLPEAIFGHGVYILIETMVNFGLISAC